MNRIRAYIERIPLQRRREMAVVVVVSLLTSLVACAVLWLLGIITD